MPDKEALLEEYMAHIAKGDHDALAALYQHTNASIYGFALSILKNASDAEDALHDCFLDIYQAAGSYRPQGKPMAWIFTIVRNRCLQKLRERGRTADIPPEDWEPYLKSCDSVTPEDRPADRRLYGAIDPGGTADRRIACGFRFSAPRNCADSAAAIADSLFQNITAH